MNLKSMHDIQLIAEEAPNQDEAVRFTVDLTKAMHYELSLLSVRTGKSKARLVRRAIWQLLRDIKNDAFMQ